jgi:hypothetical protein
MVKREFDMLYFNVARLNNLLHDTYKEEEQFTGEGLKALEDALMQEFEAWKILTLEDDPTVTQVRDVINRRLARITSPYQQSRWRGMLRLLSRLREKKRAMDQATGQGPKKEDVPTQEWDRGKDDFGIPRYVQIIEGVTFKGKPIPFKFVLLDRENLLDGMTLPTIRQVHLKRFGFVGDFYCQDAPVEGIRLAYFEFTLRDAEDKEVYKFDLPEKSVHDIKAGEFITPTFDWNSGIDSLGFSPNDDEDKEHQGLTAQVVIRILKIE